MKKIVFILGMCWVLFGFDTCRTHIHESRIKNQKCDTSISISELTFENLLPK